METDLERKLLIQIFVVINMISDKISDPKNNSPEELRQDIAQKIKKFYINSNLDAETLEKSLSLI